MRFCLLLVVLNVFFKYSSCWSAFGSNPDNYTGNGCVVGDIGELKNGEIRAMASGCGQIICMSPTYKMDGCPAISAPDGCKITADDPTKPYPECCPIINCKGEATI